MPWPPSPGVCAPSPGSTGTPSRRRSSRTRPPHVRWPRPDHEPHATDLDRNAPGALLVAAGLGRAAKRAQISLLALNGPRVSKGIGADIEDPGLERGRRTLVITRKGGKVVTIPLAPRTARALSIWPSASGPLLTVGDGRRLDRHAAYIVAALVTGAGQ